MIKEEEIIAVANEIAIELARRPGSMRACMIREGLNPNNPDDAIRYDAQAPKRMYETLSALEHIPPEELVIPEGEDRTEAYREFRESIAILRTAFNTMLRESKNARMQIVLKRREVS